jgi:hypothetical protein
VRADQQFYDRHPAVRSAWSRIAGKGSITTGPIVAGEQVVCFRIPPTSAELLPRLNHSCEPNLRWADDTHLVAIRDLPEGTEVTLDYATCIADPDFVMFCHCETMRCRQAIEGTDWQIPQLQLRYAGHWAPALQHRIDTAPR